MNSFKKISKKTMLGIFLGFFLTFGILFYFFYLKPTLPKIEYLETYRLVPEKISQSAPIRIYLPPQVTKEHAKAHLKFSPEVEGRWIEQKKIISIFDRFFSVFASSKSNYQVLFFQPKKPLELNRYYKVELALQDGASISADFLVVENPKIIAVFPKENSEASEYSEITIVFNRPMVSLTTLGENEAKEVPIKIYPETEGKFKWITTRNLQFIPKERLKRSSNYLVKIEPGFVSIEGLKVEGKEIRFMTRKLRYKSVTSGEIRFNQPIEIHFNQPVDLNKTKRAITLIDNSTGASIPFIAEYDVSEKEKKSTTLGLFDFQSILGNISETFSFLDWSEKSEGKDAGKSTILIYPRKDKFGRRKLWDFGKSYTLRIEKAYPLEGDIILNEKREATINVLPVIQEMKVESERSYFSDLDLFDPKGRLKVKFFEEINLQKSKIEAKGLKKIEYGEKCKEGDERSFEECEKVDDKSVIYLYFDENQLPPGKKIEIKFKKLVNLSNLVIVMEPIIREIKVYPPLEILKTYPSNGEISASLTELVICSTTPLKVRNKEEWQNYFFSNLDYEPNYWDSSRRIELSSWRPKCGVGQFQTTLGYGLIPEQDYSIRLILEDVFGQKKEVNLNFRTQKMPHRYVSLYPLQRSYVVTTKEKTKLTYTVTNIEYVNLEICKLDPESFLYWLVNFPKSTDSPHIIGNCQRYIQDIIQLPKRYWIKNYFQIELSKYFENPSGHYIVFLSHPDYTVTQWEKGVPIQKRAYLKTFISVTNLGVAEKKIRPQTEAWYTQEPLEESQLQKLKNLYWVTYLSNLEPAKGAEILLYQKGPTFADKYYTNKDGIAFVKVLPDLVGVIVKKDNESAVLLTSQSSLNWASYAYLSKRIYLYTDKPIYRPGQKVYIKGIYRVGYDGNWEIVKDKKVNLKIYNSKGDEIFSKDLEVSDFGTINTEFMLERNAPLGGYRVCAEYNCIYFDVQEYVPAPFEVKVSTDRDEYISKDEVKIEIEANYYFGVPLKNKVVEYTITSQNYYFDKYKDNYFHFGPEFYYWEGYHYGDKFISRGKIELSDKGRATIVQKFDIDKLFKKEEEKQSKIIVVDVTVKDSEGRSVSKEKSFILHRGEYYIGIRPEKYFVAKEEPTNIKIKTVSVEGKPIRVKNLDLEIYKIEWIWEKRQEATGGYNYRWEKKKELTKKERFSTDKEGNYLKKIIFDKEGEYEIQVKGRDTRENTIQANYTIYVFGKGRVLVPPTTNTKLELEPKKRELEVGEMGEVIIKSPYERAKALITLERGKIFEYQIIDIERNLYKYQFQTKEKYIPNIYLSVLLESSKPDIKFGTVEFKIGARKKELNIAIKPNKQFYLPGEEVILDIEVKDLDNNPVEAELSVSVVDLSVLALKGNPKKNPVMFFYGGFPLGVITSSNLKNILVETKIPTKGGGARMPSEELARKARGEFRETAYFKADIKTNKDGKAQVRFTLPDNLTTWQTEALGVTKDTRLGVGYQEFLTKKELMVVPLKPRFVIPGDEFYIGAKIFNQTQGKQKIDLEFKSSTLNLKEKTNKKSIEIKPKDSATLYFFVEAPKIKEEGEHKFILSAKGFGVEDTVVQYIKITSNDTYETTATANFTQANSSKEYIFLPENILKDKGKIEINVSATLGVFLSDALNYLIEYPYGCSEQIASKLNTIAIVKRGLNLPNLADKLKLKKVKYQGEEYSIEKIVKIGLLKLYDQQRYEGGFGFWNYGRSNFYLTLHVIETLENLKLAGFEINERVLERAKEFIKEEIRQKPHLYRDNKTIILVAYTLYKNQDKIDDPIIKSYLENIAQNERYILEEISNISLAQLAILLTKGFESSLKDKIYTTLQNRINIDARGAFLEPKKNYIFSYYFENTIKDTALYLEALSIGKIKDPIIDKVIRWLLNSKAKDGSWGSTNNTLAVIEAFVEYLKWQRETESDFVLEIFLNRKKEGEYHFNPQTILEHFKKEIPINQLNFGELNIVEFKKENLNQMSNNLYYDMSLKYYLPIEKIPPRDEGFTIQRTIHRLEDKENKNPISEARIGDVLRVHLKITVPKTRKYVLVEDFIPAGLEIVNLDLATEQKSLTLQDREIKGRELTPDFKELRDDRAVLFKETLYPGVYEFDYFVRALIKGKFIHLPARISEMYFPENFGRSAGGYFEIE